MGLGRSPEQLIKAGLAALKQKRYEHAIAAFQELNQANDLSLSYRIKAQMGLVRTYEAQGDSKQAQQLCRPLLSSRSQAIRQWATEKLEQLESQYKSSKVDLVKTAPISRANQSSQTITASGFVPFDESDNAIEASVLEQVAAEVAPAFPLKPGLTQNLTRSPEKNDAPTVSPEPAQSLADISESEPSVSTGASLFHYQTLNSNHKLDLPSVPSVATALGNEADSSNEADSRVAATSALPKLEPAAVPFPLTDKSSVKRAAPRPRLTRVESEGPDTWLKGDRLNTLKSLGKVSKGRLWVVQLITIPAIFMVVRWLLQIVLASLGSYLQFLNRFLPVDLSLANFLWGTHTWTVLVGLGVLIIVAPWLWPLMLPPMRGLTELETYSPEAAQLLRRLCAKRRWSLPKVQLLESDLPLIFSYGWRPRYGHLIVSQGLLERLEADELAAIILYDMSHWSNLDWIVLSSLGCLLQICHRAYWFLAQWGEERPILIRLAAGTLATISYEFFWILSKVGAGVARIRTPYRDRHAAELTGNPNGLVRALAKLSTAMTDAVVRQGYTPPLLESLDLLLPVGPTGGISVQQLAWGTFNPFRHWLSLNQAHPPLGERLYTLSAYARHWRLKPSLSFARLQLQNARKFSAGDWGTLLLMGGAWSGLILGLAAVVLMWLVGAIATAMDYPLLSWFYKDRSILISMPLIGLATGQLLRINTFFPDLSKSLPLRDTQPDKWQTDPKLSPLSSLPVKISGTLTGRPPLANWLGQEWRLRTLDGSIKLHYISRLGPFSHIGGLTSLLGQSLQVTGWFRRGHYGWIDLERIQTPQNQVKLAHHPSWAIVTSLVTFGYGLWLLLKGG